MRGAAKTGLRAARLLAMLLLAAPGATAESISTQRQQELAQRALNSYDDAVAAGHESPQRAEQLYREAAAAFEALRDAGIRNAALEYNLGNTYFRLNDLGRAIVHYRRAQSIDPTDERVAANLAYARQRVEPGIPPSGQSELMTRLAFWNQAVSPRARLWIAGVASALGWSGVFLWMKRRNRMVLALSGLGIILGLANAGSIVFELRQQATHPAAVVSRPNSVLRQGRGENYDAVLRQALGPGVEVNILAVRGEWCEIQLANGQVGWLPAGHLIPVFQ
jgi:tetratricopeptide (TPR) repeat protein